MLLAMFCLETPWFVAFRPLGSDIFLAPAVSVAPAVDRTVGIGIFAAVHSIGAAAPGENIVGIGLAVVSDSMVVIGIPPPLPCPYKA